MREKLTYAVLDTMVFLHFRPVEEIDWCGLTARSPIVLMITGTLIRELDRHKTQHNSSKIRERARRALRKIEEWGVDSEPKKIREGVSIAVWLDPPTVEWEAIGLDPKWEDDQLIAEAVTLCGVRPGAQVVVISDDTGPRLKAARVGLTGVELPEDLRLPPEPEPLEAENRKLKQQLAKLAQTPIPDLGLEFPDGERRLRFVRTPPPEPTPPEEKERRLSEIRSKNQPFSVRNIDRSLMGLRFPTQKEIERYNGQLPEFHKRYEAYLEELDAHGLLMASVFLFEICLSNSGRAPAEDIDVGIHFPDGSVVLEPENVPASPVPPRPPKPPRSSLELMSHGLNMNQYPSFDSRLSGIMSDLAPRVEPNVSEPRIKKTDSFEVQYKVGKLKHGFTVPLGSLALRFDSVADIKSFSASFWIHAAELPDPSEGELNFIF